ncbi:MAG: hypothetical protein V7K35_14400 [Nostoc sp.]|uniref:hypothetical protein n=1 Tax=Nostoc sp. TaxID=1180 RepID=UPI002FF9F8C2
MLFNSYEFIFLFLPLALGGFFLFCWVGIRSLVTGWLLFVSLIFYGYWNAKFLLLLLVSIAVNWLVSQVMARLRTKLLDGRSMTNAIRVLLFLGIAFNLGLIGYFKYINFFIDTINGLGTSLGKINDIILPLGISFYTFEQISYLVGVALGKGRHYNLPRFMLFCHLFPSSDCWSNSERPRVDPTVSLAQLSLRCPQSGTRLHSFQHRFVQEDRHR